MREPGITVDGALDLALQGPRAAAGRAVRAQPHQCAGAPGARRERIVAFVTGEGERHADRQGECRPRHLRRAAGRAAACARCRCSFAQVTRGAGAHRPGRAGQSARWRWRRRCAGAGRLSRPNGGNLLWLTEPANDDLGLDAAGRRAWRARAARHAGRWRRQRAGPARSALDRAGRLSAARDHARLPADHAVPAARPRWRSSPNRLGGQAVPAQSGAKLERVPADRNGEAAGTIRYDADAGEFKGPLDFGFALIAPVAAARTRASSASS